MNSPSKADRLDLPSGRSTAASSPCLHAGVGRGTATPLSAAMEALILPRWPADRTMRLDQPGR
jgi:hypothetical protein